MNLAGVLTCVTDLLGNVIGLFSNALTLNGFDCPAVSSLPAETCTNAPITVILGRRSARSQLWQDKLVAQKIAARQWKAPRAGSPKT